MLFEDHNIRTMRRRKRSRSRCNNINNDVSSTPKRVKSINNSSNSNSSSSSDMMLESEFETLRSLIPGISHGEEVTEVRSRKKK